LVLGCFRLAGSSNADVCLSDFKNYLLFFYSWPGSLVFQK